MGRAQSFLADEQLPGPVTLSDDSYHSVSVQFGSLGYA
jgi:hypothetical protein